MKKIIKLFFITILFILFPNFSNSQQKVNSVSPDKNNLSEILYNNEINNNTIDSTVLPVELSYFTAVTERNNVTLYWMTIFEINNSVFEIERFNPNGLTWILVGIVKGKGTTFINSNYTFAERGLASGKYKYRMKQIDLNGNFRYYYLSKYVIIGIPMKTKLSQNYPNPFNPSTKIDYVIAYDGKVNIKLIDITGKEVATLLDKTTTPGYYTFQFNASDFPAGIYFYKMTTSGFDNGVEYNFTDIKKMLLVK